MNLDIKTTIALFIFILILSIFLAYLEIQIEGIDGWAKNLPTWKINISNFQITGYHLSIWTFIFLLSHFPLFFIGWSLKKESFVLSFFILLLLLEDSFWFLLNDQFKGKCDIWRHPKIGAVPMFYLVGLFFTLFFALFSYSLNWFICVVFLIIMNTITFYFQVRESLT